MNPVQSRQPMTKEDSRKAFEKWYAADAMPLEHSNWFKLDADGEYEDDHVQTNWRAWQAAGDS
jgi:hypothetical protein